MIQSRRIRQYLGRLVDWKWSKIGVSGSALEGWSTGKCPKAYQAVLWKVGRLEMVQSRRIGQYFGRLVDRKLSKVGVSGSTLEGWSPGNGPK